jgi:hypothetical protein
VLQGGWKGAVIRRDVSVAGRVLSSGGMYGAGGSSMEHDAITAVVGALVRHPCVPTGDKSYCPELSTVLYFGRSS